MFCDFLYDIYDVLFNIANSFGFGDQATAFLDFIVIDLVGCPE